MSVGSFFITFRGVPMRFPLAVTAAAIIAVAVAACNAGQPANYIAPPAGGGTTTGPLALGPTSQTQSAGSANGITGSLSYVGGTGTVTAASSATAPAGTTTVSPAGRIRISASATSPTVYYVTISSAAGATLTGLPAIALLLTTPAVGTFQEAQFSKGTWTNVPGATSVTNTAGTAVQFPSTATGVTIPAGGSIFLAFYQGSYPQPTPPGQVANDIINNPSFASATYADWPATPNATGWTQCTFNSSATGSTAPHAYPAFTPDPGETPLASIQAIGAPAPSFGTPVPAQQTVPGPGVGSTNAAVLGGSFVGFSLEDFRYQGLCQVVTIPTNPSMTLSVFAAGNQKQSFFELEVNLLNSAGQFVANVYTDPNPIAVPTASNTGDTAYRMVTVPQSSLTPYVGQTYTLFLGIWGNGHGNFSGYYFVNNFTLAGS
jgi:hypothetical protein